MMEIIFQSNVKERKKTSSRHLLFQDLLWMIDSKKERKKKQQKKLSS